MATEADAKKMLAEERDKRAKDAEERAKTRGKPTPTQAELDLIALGHHPELEADGSLVDRQLQAQPGGTYETRQMAGAPRSRPEPPRG